MAKDIARFEKVSLSEFKLAMFNLYPETDWDDEELVGYYSNIKLPTRGTKNSVGYDFVTPFGFRLDPGTKICIPTGIRVKMYKEDYGLFVMPKSRSVKSSIRLSNTIGVIDPDYYYSGNEGHIIIWLEMPVKQTSPKSISKRFGTLLNRKDQSFTFNSGDQIVQGILLETGKVTNDIFFNDDRDGGFGSTGNGNNVNNKDPELDPWEENITDKDTPDDTEVPSIPMDPPLPNYDKMIKDTVNNIIVTTGEKPVIAVTPDVVKLLSNSIEWRIDTNTMYPLPILYSVGDYTLENNETVTLISSENFKVFGKSKIWILPSINKVTFDHEDESKVPEPSDVDYIIAITDKIDKLWETAVSRGCDIVIELSKSIAKKLTPPEYEGLFEYVNWFIPDAIYDDLLVAYGKFTTKETDRYAYIVATNSVDSMNFKLIPKKVSDQIVMNESDDTEYFYSMDIYGKRSYFLKPYGKDKLNEIMTNYDFSEIPDEKDPETPPPIGEVEVTPGDDEW